jgi:3-phosphoglycerate kinase
MELADYILIGGALANNFLKANRADRWDLWLPKSKKQ